jgi:AmiR/NasT family two-component response regulator
MTAQRFIQNFRHSRGVLFGGADLGCGTLEKTLSKLGMTLSGADSVDLATLDDEKDVLLIDGDQPLHPGAFVKMGSSVPMAPAIGIVGTEAPSRLKLLLEAGVTAFLRKPLHAGTIYAALFLGVNGYRRLRAMEDQLAENARRRRDRRFVIKAVVALVQARGLTDDEAYAQIRRASMQQRLGIEEFCAALYSRDGGIVLDQWKSFDSPAGWREQTEENVDASHDDDRSRNDGGARSDVRKRG